MLVCARSTSRGTGTERNLDLAGPAGLEGAADGERGRGTESRLAIGCALGMALSAAGSWCRFALEPTTQLNTHTFPFLVGSLLSGAGLIATGVCALRLASTAGRLGWRKLWLAALAVQALGFLALPLTSTDVFSYLTLGKLTLEGLSPYLNTPVALGDSPYLFPLLRERWIHELSAYGPMFHWLAALAVAAGERTPWALWGAIWTFKAIMLGSVVAALAIAARHLRTLRPEAAAEVFVVLALGPFIAWEICGQAHNDGLLFLFLIAFFALASKGREAAAVAALAAGISIKYSLAPLLGLYLVLVARFSLRKALSLGVLSLAILALGFAPEWGSVTLAPILQLVGGDHRRVAHSLADLLCNLFDWLGQPAASASAVRMLSALSLVLGLAVLAWTALRARSLEEVARGYLLFLMAMYLTAPWFQPWYCTWALPVLLVEPDARWRRFVALYMVITVAQWIAPLDPVTTVAANAWAAIRIAQLLRVAPEELVAGSEPEMSQAV